jgi:hypothetical protein
MVAINIGPAVPHTMSVQLRGYCVARSSSMLINFALKTLFAKELSFIIKKLEMVNSLSHQSHQHWLKTPLVLFFQSFENATRFAIH